MKSVITQKQADMKLANMHTIFHLLYDKSPLSRAELARLSGMSPTSITRIISGLMDSNLITESETDLRKVGRKATLLHINKDACYTVGINIDAKFLQLSVLDFSKAVTFQKSIIISSVSDTPAQVLHKAFGIYQEALSILSLSPSQIVGIGVSISGVTDETGCLVFSPQLKWQGIRLQEEIENRFQLSSVLIENDCNSALLGECVRHPEYRHQAIACICFGSGVGSAFCQNGELFKYNGQNSFSEVGHITVDPNGMLCDCGNHGCLQTFIARQALVDRSHLYDEHIASMEDLYEHWKSGTPWAKKLIQTSCAYLKAAMNTISCLYHPDILFIGGESMDLYPEMFSEALSGNQHFFPPLSGKVEVLVLPQKYDSSILGLSSQIQEKYLSGLLSKLIL